jgi:VanZ family protein
VRRLRRAAILAAPLAWMALIFALSSVPGRRMPSAHAWDKAAHFCEYAVLGWLLQRALREAGLSPRRAAVAAAISAAAWGVSDEWHQSFVPRRSVEAADALADALGAATAAAAAAALDLRRARASRGPEHGAPGG